jgi:predicted DCC family thiol-disulfide oxidoreductase YuxK
VARQVALVRIGLAAALLAWAPAAFASLPSVPGPSRLLPIVWLAAGLSLLVGVAVRPAALALGSVTALGLSPLPPNPALWVAITTALILVGLAGSSASLGRRGAAPPSSSSRGTALAGGALQLLVTVSWLALSLGALRDLRTGGAWDVADVAGLLAGAFVAVALWNRTSRHWAFVASLVMWWGNGTLSAAGVPASLAAALVWSGMVFIDEEEGSRLVVWDDRCSLCRPRVALLRRLDWLRVHRFEGASNRSALKEIGLTQDDVNREMRLRAGRGVLGGFDALVGVLKLLPVGFLWAPVLSVPPLHRVGVRAYRYVAGHW